MVRDGAANFKSCLIEMFKEENWIWYYAHELNLVVQKVLWSNEDIAILIKTVRTIVKQIRNSSNARLKLKKSQRDMSIEEKDCRELILDCKTRWNSTFVMIQRYIDLEIYIYSALKECRNGKADALVMFSTTFVLILKINVSNSFMRSSQTKQDILFQT